MRNASNYENARVAADVSLLSGTAIVPSDLPSVLNSSLENANINLMELKALIKEAELKQKQNEVLKKYRIEWRKEIGRWRTYIGGMKRERKDKQKLIDLILEFEGVSADTTPPLRALWKGFEKRRRAKRADTTVQLDIRYKDMYLSKSRLWTKCAGDITRDDAYEFFEFCRAEKKRPKERKKGVRETDLLFKQRYWWQIQATMGAFWDYICEQGYAQSNIFKDMDIHPDNFDEPTFTPEEDTVFSAWEARRVKQLALEDAENTRGSASLGILLLFTLGLRVGEICALQWRDIITLPDGRKQLHIQREIVHQPSGGYKLLNHAKTRAGDRYLPLNNYCQELLKKVRTYNVINGAPVLSPDDFIFQRKWRKTWTHCTTSSFNPRIRKYCNMAGMNVIKSCHDIRRTCLTEMYDAGIPLKQLQYFAGHETPMQTLDYIRRRNDFDITEYILDDSDLLGGYPEKGVETEKVKKVKVV